MTLARYAGPLFPLVVAATLFAMLSIIIARKTKRWRGFAYLASALPVFAGIASQEVAAHDAMVTLHSVAILNWEVVDPLLSSITRPSICGLCISLVCVALNSITFAEKSAKMANHASAESSSKEH